MRDGESARFSGFELKADARCGCEKIEKERETGEEESTGKDARYALEEKGGEGAMQSGRPKRSRVIPSERCDEGTRIRDSSLRSE